MLYHGNENGLVGYGQSELVYEKACEICHDTTYYELETLGHSSEEVYSALAEKPPATATVRTVHCPPSDNAPRERVKEGPVASLTDMEPFFRHNLRT